MSRYAGGAAAERELKAALEMAYPESCVVRAAGSHGVCDVMMDGDACTFAFQVKTCNDTKGLNRSLTAARRDLAKRKWKDTTCPMAAIRCHGEWHLFYQLPQSLGIYQSKAMTNDVRAAVAKLRRKKAA